MINVGIIGTGLIAREHAQAIAMLPGMFSLVAAADVDRQRLNLFAESFGVQRSYDDATQLIADPDVSLVTITTPPSAHETLAVQALDTGKYVLCEKPLAHSLASAGRIIEAEQRHPGRLTVSHQLRFESSFRRLLWLCQNNWIGNLQSGSIERHSYIPHTDHGKSGWWGSWNVAGGGVLITQLIHELDLLVLAMGRPKSVSAVMDTCYTKIESEDYAKVTIRFTDGKTAHCVASVNSGRITGSLTIQGSSGSVGLPWSFLTTNPSQATKALRQLDVALPDTRPASRSLASRGTRFIRRKLGVKPNPELTPHARLYRQIANSIQLDIPLPIPAKDALPALEVCFAAYASAITGNEVAVPLSTDNPIYDGISKEQYDARKCPRVNSARKVVPIALSKANCHVMRVGLIGVDTTHATAFTGVLHDPNNPFHIPGAKVVAAFPGGSPDMPVSISRVGGFTDELRKTFGVRIAESPEAVAGASDLIFILASDGRTHPGLLRSVAGYGKPVFLDKPFALSASDAKDMFAIATTSGTHIFASSAFRYADGLVNALNSIKASGERVKSCSVHYWLQIQPTQGRYFWYGIHGAEMLLAIMGCGVREVEASVDTADDRITVCHDDGRQSSIVGSTTDGTFRVSIVTDRREVKVDLGSSMSSLAARVLWAALDNLSEGRYPRLWSATTVGSVSGSRPSRPLDPDMNETVEVVSLLEAAQRSYASGQRVFV